MSTWTSTGHRPFGLWDYFTELCFSASPPSFSYHFLWKVSQIPILTKV